MIQKVEGLWFWHLIDKNNMLGISNCADTLIFDFLRKKKKKRKYFSFLKGKNKQLFSDLLKEIIVFPITITYFMDLGYLLTHKISVQMQHLAAQWSLTFYTIFHLDLLENTNLDLI